MEPQDPGGMAARPTVALAMLPGRTPNLIGPAQMERLQAVSHVLDWTPLTSFSGADASALLAEADVLLTGWGCGRIDAEVLARAPRLRLVAHTGSTVKPIVSDALWARDIAVTSAAAANAVPVAEFTLAAILLANKGVFSTREDYRTRRTPGHYPWVAAGQRGNLGATVGVVGASRTGRRLLELLRPFDLRVLVFDPLADARDIEALGGTLLPLDEVAAAADVLSIHAPLLPGTRHMIGAAVLARLRAGATLINTSRGEVVDPEALERELVSGRLCAVLDVTSPEPLNRHSPLFDLPNVFITPHMAGATGHETRRMADAAIEAIACFAARRPLQQRVTREMLRSIG